MIVLYLPNSYSQQRQRQKPSKIYPVLMAMEAQKYRNEGHEVVWASQINYYKLFNFDKIITEPEGLPFLSLPHPDRVFTRAKDYTSGNYKHLPGTHIMSASGCWWGKCTFCVENRRAFRICNTQNQCCVDKFINKPYEIRPVEDVIAEIEECKALGFREVFDDSATFPVGVWLDRFCDRLASINGICFSCNMRMVDCDYHKLHKVGFRMLLFGVESANQRTLDKIKKGVKVEDIRHIIKAEAAGLEPHGAFMFGFPWESDSEAINTLRLAHYLLRKGYLKTAQASFYTPPGAKKDGCVCNNNQRRFVRKLYDVKYSPEFWFNQLRSIRTKDDVCYLWRKIKAGLNDYKNR